MCVFVLLTLSTISIISFQGAFEFISRFNPRVPKVLNPNETLNHQMEYYKLLKLFKTSVPYNWRITALTFYLIKLFMLVQKLKVRTARIRVRTSPCQYMSYAELVARALWQPHVHFAPKICIPL